MSANATKASQKSLFEGFDPKNAGEEVLKFWKLSFDTAFDNLSKIQDYNEKLMEDMYSKSKEIQADSTKALNDWTKNAKKGQDEYKKVVDAGFGKLQEMI